MSRRPTLPAAAVACLSLLLPSARADSPPSVARQHAERCTNLLSGGSGWREELTYAVRWGLVNAGTAVLKMTPVVDGGELAAYRIETLARSNSFIDVFYPVRDTTTSLVDASFSRSLFYSKSQREGGFSRDEVLEYDLLDGLSLLYRDGKLRNSLRLPEEFQDPVSGLYRFRAIGASPGDTVGMYATDGVRLMLIKGTILGREEVATPAGRFDCLKVELFPETLEGPFIRKKKGRILMWFSDDRCRLPVKMSTEIFIGAVETVLEKAEYRPAGSGTGEGSVP